MPWQILTALLALRKPYAGLLTMPRGCHSVKACQNIAKFTCIGLTALAIASTIIDNFPVPNFGNKCHYTVNGIIHDAFNTACFGGCECSPGNCLPEGIRTYPIIGCIYSDQNGVSGDLIKQGAQTVLGCQGPKGTVNGRTKLQTGSDAPSICLSNGNGCGGCFHNE